ncbi:MAG: S41 family peptidase [Actinomycetota bacterium]
MLDRLSSKIFAAAAAAALLFAAFLFGYGVGRQSAHTEAADFSLLNEVESHIRQAAVGKVDRDSLLNGAIQGMVRSLDDPYSEYLDAASYRAVRDSLTSHFSGVGISIKQEGEEFEVVTVLDNTPAARAGIVPGDRIVSVDGDPVGGLKVGEVAQAIQGDPGSRVTITVNRGAQALDFTLERERIERVVAEGELLQSRLGLVEVIAFTSGTGKEVREIVRGLIAEGALGFILDLRGNPGGLLDEGVEVAGTFLDRGRVVSYRERGESEVVYQAPGSPETQLPLVVMVDAGTASAAEIVAGAIQDRGRGIVIGTQTYGKGSVQTLIPLSDGSAIKLTTASFFTPSGRAVSDRGINPDIRIDDRALQLARAQEILREILALGPAA